MSLLKDKGKRGELRRELYEKLDSSGEELAQTLKSMRKILAMDQQAFARFVGVSVSTLRKIEQDKGNVGFDLVKRILETFSFELVVKLKGKPR